MSWILHPAWRDSPAVKGRAEPVESERRSEPLTGNRATHIIIDEPNVPPATDADRAAMKAWWFNARPDQMNDPRRWLFGIYPGDPEVDDDRDTRL